MVPTDAGARAARTAIAQSPEARVLADALRYLTEQKQLINNAKTKINQSIEQAQTYLRQ